MKHGILLLCLALILASALACDNPGVIDDSAHGITTDTLHPTTDSIIQAPDTTLYADTISPATPPVVSTFPTAYDVWEGHVVAAITSQTEREATLLLLSLADWPQMTSAVNTAHPTTCFSEASSYSEHGLTNWTIPTEAQARLLYASYSNAHTTDNGNKLDSAISQAGGTPIVLKEGANNIRYLCQEATKTFSFYQNRVIAAGATVKTYHLRLVHEVHISLQ